MTTAKLIRVIVSGLVAVGVVVLAIAVLDSGSTPSHKITVTIPEATGVLAGDFVRSAGTQVGSVTSVQAVEGGREAEITMSLDDSVWPLSKGSSFTVRWGGTIDEYDRYITLVRARSNQGSIVTASGSIPAANFHVPVEYGSLLSAFTPSVRAGLKSAINHGGASLEDAKTGLKATLKTAPAALTQVNAVVEDLDSNESTLRDLVSSTGSVVNAVDTSDPGLSDLLQGASGTFSAIAAQDTNLKSTLSGAPQTLTEARTTLKQADTTLVGVQRLATNIKPGVQKLVRISEPLDHLLTTITRVSPDLNATLSTAVTSAPNVTTLVSKVTDLSPQLDSTLDQANTALDCIRPYTPEIAAFGSDWGSALSGNVQGTVYIRANPQVLIPAPYNGEAGAYANAGDVQKAYPGLAYDFPTAPGAAADEPWYLPACGITAKDNDAAADPESAYWSSLGSGD
jgi:phospholipid/cholesterol/gamma-HCH transport system substrate-binding protein